MQDLLASTLRAECTEGEDVKYEETAAVAAIPRMQRGECAQAVS